MGCNGILQLGAAAPEVVAACSANGSSASHAGAAGAARPKKPPTSGSTAPTVPAPAVPTTTGPPLFAHYYLWWAAPHWRSKVGPAYPLKARPAPLPATLDADGCRATPNYQGDTLVDVPTSPPGLYSQDDPSIFARQIAEAAGAGIDGFVVSWSGTGARNQVESSRDFNHRLDLLVKAVDAYNSHATKRFSLMLGYQGLDNSRAQRNGSTITNDLAYFVGKYASDPAFQVPRYGSKPVTMMLDSRRFDVATLGTVLSPFRSRLTLIGDEHGVNEWNRGASDLFDGDGWYWSAENPYTNHNAAKALTQLAQTLHAQHKLWFAPLSGGYNKSNFGVGGTCVPRRGGATLRTVFDLNRRSAPDGWMYISWNEFFENTYVEPSARYGTTLLDELRALRS